MHGDIVVTVGAGEYFLNTPLEFNEADSGRNGFEVRYVGAEEHRSTRIVGGVRISEWTPHSGEILRARVAITTPITTLFENGVRADEARFPNRETLSRWPSSRAGYLTIDNLSPSSTLLKVGAADGGVFRADMTTARIFVWPGHDWFTDVVPVAAADAAQGQITLAEETRYPMTKGSRYFILGSLALLDSPGEFFHDVRAGYLYYWPRSTSRDREIIVPTMKSALIVHGSSPERPVENLAFENLRFEASTFPTWYRFGWPRAGHSGESHIAPSFDRQIEMPANRFGLVTFENTRKIRLKNLHIKNSGLSGLYMKFGNRDNCVYGSLVEHAGVNGIALQGAYPGEGDVLRDNVISNSFIRNVGEMVGNAAGVDLLNTGFNEISYSLIQDSPRFGVAWHAGVPTGTPSYVQGNQFKYLRIERVGADSGDMGAVYSFGLNADFPGASRVNTVENIVVSTVVAHPSMQDLKPHGVFMDNDTPGQIFRNIRVETVDGSAFYQNAGHHEFHNVSWQPGFVPALVDENKIGLRSDFPSMLLTQR